MWWAARRSEWTKLRTAQDIAGVKIADLSVGVLGVLVMTSEYATGSIALTLAATPQRRVVLAAKVVTFSLVVAVVGPALVLHRVLRRPGAVRGQARRTVPQRPGRVAGRHRRRRSPRPVRGHGHGAGAIFRRTAGAIAVLFAALLVVPGLVTLLPSPWKDDVTKYLPSVAGTAMSAVHHFPDLLSPAAGLLVMLACTAVILLLATVVLTRRDA